MASSSQTSKRRKRSFHLMEKLNLEVDTITKIATERKKAGLVVANSADVPLWLTDDELTRNILTKRPKPAVFSESPLRGSFTDGFAMYSTFLDTENTTVKLGINMTGSELLKSLSAMFKETANGVKDFFVCYSGIGKSFNGDWLCCDEADECVQHITLDRIVKKWSARPSASKDQFLLICADTNYAGIWAQKAKDRKLLQKHNVLVQASVGRLEPSLEMTIGEIKPPCWITQIVCGKFSHNWLEICASAFYETEGAVLDMKGSFVVLDKAKVWDANDEYHADTDHPMSNVEGAKGEETMLCIPCYGYHERQGDEDDDDEEEKEKSEDQKNGVRFVETDGVETEHLGGRKRRESHLPQPSVRRLNLLQGVVGGLKLKKHKKKKSRHVSTYSRGFVFSNVLREIRHMVMGSDDENEEEDQQNNSEWIDDE